MNKIPLTRYNNNPILNPDSANDFESYAVFNGCPVRSNDNIYLLYRAIGIERNINGKYLRPSTIGIAQSQDGKNFYDRRTLIFQDQDFDRYGCEDPRVTYFDGKYYIFYTALSSYPPNVNSIKIAVAVTSDLSRIEEKHPVTPFNGKAMALFSEKINGKYTVLLTVNTDNPPSKIAIAQFDKIEDIWSSDYWRIWYQHLDDHIIPLQRISSDQIEVGSPPVKTQYGWLLIYSYIRDYFSPARNFAIESVMLDADNPKKITGVYYYPMFLPTEKYELEGTVPNIVFPSGALIDNDNLNIYYGGADTVCCLATIKLEDFYKRLMVNAVRIPKFKKYSYNPIIEPVAGQKWRSNSVFNPAAVYEGGRVHLLYRAMGEDNTSVIGYASSPDGYNFDIVSNTPVYVPRETCEKKYTPNCYSGCEDPRLTKINDKIYMLYTAYTGQGETRVAITHIAVNDFIANNWQWSKPVLISPPGVNDKDACLFPDTINGKYVIFHRIEGDIVIDYEDDLNFEGKNDWVRIQSYITPTDMPWESDKIGISTPPLKTEAGWLIFYHGVNKIDRHYRIGAMLLNLENPAHILAKTKYPVLEPTEPYEKFGVVNNVVFPCGAVKIDDTIFLYYGGADKVIGVATYSYSQLLNYLIEARKKKYLI